MRPPIRAAAREDVELVPLGSASVTQPNPGRLSFTTVAAGFGAYVCSELC